VLNAKRMENVMHVKTVDQTRDAMLNGHDTALDRFLFEHEPCPQFRATKFRQELREVLEEHSKNPCGSEIPGPVRYSLAAMVVASVVMFLLGSVFGYLID